MQRYQEAAFHLAYVIVGERREAEDVTQDAFVKAYVALPSFQPTKAFRPWLLQIVANEARNRRRAAGRREHLVARAAADERLGAAGAQPSPETVALAEEQRRVLLAEVDALRDEDRLAIAGRYFMDLSEAEIADMLGCARGTVKSRVSRGLARLRERLRAREAIAILVGSVLLGLGLLAWPDARNAIADRLGRRGISITHVADVPSPPPTAIPAADQTAPGRAGIGVAPASAGEVLGLGPSVTLSEARERFGAPVLLPAALGAPAGLYLMDGQLSVVYSPGPALPPVPQAGGVGLLLTELRATLETNLVLGKGIPPGTRVVEARVGASQGLWIDGAPHLFFREAGPRVRDLPPRLAGSTLLWEQGELTLRIESALGPDEAVRVAESARGTD